MTKEIKEKILDYIQEIEIGLGSAQAIMPYVEIPGDHEDPSSIGDCKNNVEFGYRACIELQKFIDSFNVEK